MMRTSAVIEKPLRNKIRLLNTTSKCFYSYYITKGKEIPLPKSSETTTTTTTPNEEFLKHTATKISDKYSQPKSIFPWRHSPLSLDRLDPSPINIQTRIYNPMGPRFPAFPPIPRFLMRLSSEGYLNIPVWKSILAHIPFSPVRWDQELAMQFSWAFGKAVSGMITNTYRVPNVEQEDEDGSIRVDFQYTSNDDDNGCEIDDEEASIENSNNSKAMIHANLQNLYTAAHHSTSPLSSKSNSGNIENNENETKTSADTIQSPQAYQITLETQPVTAQIESILFIPILTREHVEENPNFKGRFLQLLEEVAYKKLVQNESFTTVIQEFYESVLQLQDRLRAPYNNDDYYHVTIIAQASILCQERFQVRHIDTGEIVQGSEDGKKQDVVHLARFEMVNVVDENGKLVEMGSWQITDWDDLLDGNVWF